MIEPDVLISDFGNAAAKAGIRGWPCPLRFETLPAPHQKPALPPGEGAVYVFTTGSAYGSSAPCGAGTVLKVGKVGPGNKRRFRHSHLSRSGEYGRSRRAGEPRLSRGRRAARPTPPRGG
jgi:hypothetical protein